MCLLMLWRNMSTTRISFLWSELLVHEHMLYLTSITPRQMTRSCIELPFVCLHSHQVVLYTKSDLVLHPRYKKSYFVHKKWLPDWIDTVVSIAQEIWDRYYKPTITKTCESESQVSHFYHLHSLLTSKAQNQVISQFQQFIR